MEKQSRGGTTVVLSGGQDSTTVLYWAAQQGFNPIHAVTFDYGQRHVREKAAAIRIGLQFKEDHPDIPFTHEVVRIPPSALQGTSPLTDHSRELGQYESAEALPGGIEDTFVPFRNLLFLTIAANHALVRGHLSIMTGVSEEDFGGYPDCRDVFMRSLVETLHRAVEGSCPHSLEIETPLLQLNKERTVKLGVAVGAMTALGLSHTCYAGEEVPCGKCHACLLRARGFQEAGVDDPLITRLKAAGKIHQEYPGSGLIEA